MDTCNCFRIFDHGYKFFATQGQWGQVKPGQLANLPAVSTHLEWSLKQATILKDLTQWIKLKWAGQSYMVALGGHP